MFGFMSGWLPGSLSGSLSGSLPGMVRGRVPVGSDRPGVRGRWTVAGATALAALACGLCGCRGGGTATTSAGPVIFDERRAAFPTPDADFAKLGYRLDWVGYPDVSRGESIREMAVYSDVVVTQDTSGTVAVLESNTGARRWANQIGERLTRFVGLSRMDGLLLASSDAELFVLRMDNGGFTETNGRQRLSVVVNTRPLLYADTAVYGTARGEILSHSVSTGLRRWGFDTRSAIDTPPVMVDQGVATVSNSGQVTILNPLNGSVIGNAKMFGGVATNPISTGTSLVVASLDQSLYCFGADGRQLWRYRTPRPLRTQPTHDAGVVYCDISDNGLTAFRASNGEIIWKNPNVRGEVIASRAGRLLAWDGQSVTVVDRSRGDLIDRVAMPAAMTLVPDAFNDGNLYIASKSGLVAKLTPR